MTPKIGAVYPQEVSETPTEYSGDAVRPSEIEEMVRSYKRMLRTYEPNSMESNAIWDLITELKANFPYPDY